MRRERRGGERGGGGGGGTEDVKLKMEGRECVKIKTQYCCS